MGAGSPMGRDGTPVTMRTRRLFLAGGLVALLALGTAGCASNASLSASSLTTLSVPTSDAGAQQECVSLGISAADCTQALNALHGAGLP